MQAGTLTTTPAGPRTGPDRCPTTTELHESRDGWLLRVRLPGGRITPTHATRIASLAADGDTIELTGRGNLQLRGLTHEAAIETGQRLQEAGLVPSPAHEKARTILASPLAGRRHDSAGAVDELVAALDRAILADPATAGCSGRMLTVVDDGSGHELAGDADLVLRLAPAGSVTLALGGRIASSVPLEDAAPLAAELLGRCATLAAEHGAWRARELPDGLLTELAPGDPLELGPPAVLPLGLLAQAGDLVAVRGETPLGRLTPTTLHSLGTLAAGHGTELRIDHLRTVTLPDLPAGTATGVRDALAASGLTVSEHDPAHGLTACAGLACQRCEVDVREAARLRLQTRRPSDGREHLVGCARQCGAGSGTLVVVAEPGETPAQLAARAATPSSPSSTDPAPQA